MMEEYEPLYKEVMFAQELDRIDKLMQDGTIEEDKADQYVFELKKTAMDMLEIKPPSAEEVAAAIKEAKEINQREVEDALKGVSADGTKVTYRIVGKLAVSEEDTNDNVQQDTEK